MCVVRRAAAFAAIAHASQVRKFSGLPYIIHPAAVAALVASVPYDPAVVAAAWLHDVVEDCGVGLPVIAKEFGNDVADIVGMVSKVSKLSDGPRALRKAMDRAHYARGNAAAHNLKVADMIHNMNSFLADDPAFLRDVVAPENRALLNVLNKADPILIAAADRILVANNA